MAPKKPEAPKAPEAPKTVETVDVVELAKEGTIVKAINKKGETLTMNAEHYNKYAEELTLVNA